MSIFVKDGVLYVSGAQDKLRKTFQIWSSSFSFNKALHYFNIALLTVINTTRTLHSRPITEHIKD